MKGKLELMELLNKAVEIAYLDENLYYEYFDFDDLGQTFEKILLELKDIE